MSYPFLYYTKFKMKWSDDVMETVSKYAIKSLSMTNYLVREGFDIIGASDNEFNPKFKVFFFIDTQELRTAMSKFQKQSN